MSFTFTTAYSNVVTGLLKSGGWINRLNQGIEIPGGFRRGVIDVPVLTTVSAQTITVATIPTQGINNTVASLTGVDKVVPYIVQETEIDSFYAKDPAALMAIAEKAADSLKQAAEGDAIAGLVAATPDSTRTLASGHANFELGTTTPADFKALLQQTLGGVIAHVATQTGGNYRKIMCVAAQTAYENIYGMAGVIPGVNLDGNGELFYNTVPIYPVVSTTTDWGGASEECVFALHEEAYAMKMFDAYMQGGGILTRSDAVNAIHWVAPYFHGVVFENGIAAVINGAS